MSYVTTNIHHSEEPLKVSSVCLWWLLHSKKIGRVLSVCPPMPVNYDSGLRDFNEALS